MMTTKKRRRLRGHLLVVAALGMLLTACRPPGAGELRRAEREIQSGQFTDAIVDLKDATRILADAPLATQAKAWNLLGLACQDGGQLDAASKAYSQAIKLDRNNATVMYNLGCLRCQQTNYLAAIDYLTTYLTFRPKDVQGYLRMGAALFQYALERPGLERSRLLEAARHEFEAAEKIRVTPEAANALGVLRLQGRSPGAEAVHVAATNFVLALNRDTNFAPAMLNLAIVSQEYLNNPKQALRLYGEYLAENPAPPNAKQVAKVAHDLDVSQRIIITPQPARAPEPAPVPKPLPRPEPPVVKTNAAPSTPIAVTPRPPPEESPPKPQPAIAPPPIQVVTSTPPAQPVVPPPQVQPQPPPESPPPRVSAPPAAAPSPVEAPPVANPSNVVPAPVVTDTNAEPRKSLTQRLNPLRWFSPKPATRPPAIIAPEPPLVPPGSRYAYPPRITPIPGNRVRARDLAADALRARQAGDLAESIHDYNDAIAADPTYYDACYGLAVTALEARDYATALEQLDRAVALREDSAEARYTFAWTLQKRGYTEDAAHELGRLLDQHPENVNGHLLLGKLYAEKLKQPRLAREQYTQVLQLDPANAQSANIRAWLERNP
ncbi:MAG TPA: tetratricopeptide repeat protein [Verrucomicrobiae bacterium]|jgi:tetratricopeptide (TPR) repeat protein